MMTINDPRNHTTKTRKRAAFRAVSRELVDHIALTLLAILLLVAIFDPHRTAQANNDEKNKPPVDEKAALIESALYTRVEFFGAQALVPYPTGEARIRLAAVQAKYAGDPQIELKLSQLDEKLGREADATAEMRAFVDHEPDKMKALETMAAFFDRRAKFSDEAETLERLLETAPPNPPNDRVEVFKRLIDLARTHLLQKYLAPAFYERTLAQNPATFEIIEQYLQKLVDERSYPEALKLVRQYKDRFPDRRAFLIEKEATILDEIGREPEAEAVYTKAFDPFWPAELSDSFYQLLKDHDRFRAYGHELRTAFRRDPADFDTAVRLLHYSKYAYQQSPEVFVQLEKARAAKKIGWKQAELITITRLLIADDYADAASRFLYTLYLRGEMKPGSELRAKVLYQLFELLSDANQEKLSLTRGDLKFYQDIATADPHPGLLGGILSLVLSDTNPKEEFKIEEARAAKYFNRAAAFRIFTAYKQENPTAPELAQMYLDIVRLYTATKETEVAATTLAEFEGRYADAPRYPEVALKLADCYVATGKVADERALYQRLLDYLGKHRQKGAPLVPSAGRPPTSSNSDGQIATLTVDSEPTTVKPVVPYSPSSNPGIAVPTDDASSNDSDSENGYTDFLDTPELSHGAEDPAAESEQASTVDYATVLTRYVASLDKENRTQEILALYAGEIKKYGDEQGLYEQLLQWLGQTNMAEEQLRVYQETLKKFPTTMWRDRLARWFLRQKRNQEFETLSRDLIAKLNDDEAESYLRKFVDSGANANASSFDANLYRTLYLLAHERFPHNLSFVKGLMRFYVEHKEWPQWRALVAEYYFESREIRDQFLAHVASRGELRAYFERAREACDKTSSDVTTLLPYKLFHADAAVWLSNYEEAVAAYRELNQLYPNTPEFAERLVSFTRSFGQHDRGLLKESGDAALALADAVPASADYRTRAGEIQAELGDYVQARTEWEKLIAIGCGAPETYFDTATIYWDYFQYDDALRTIKALRRQTNDETRYAFQAGVILEGKHQLREALAEYIKALAANDSDYENAADSARTKKRLVTLTKRPGVWEQIVAAFNQERSRNDSWEFIWEYVDFLNDAKRWPAASTLLHEEMARQDSQEFLRRVRDLFADNNETSGKVAALRRLITVAPSQRLAISYRLQLAETYAQVGQRNEAGVELQALLQKYPTNYGVLSETANFYWRLSQCESSLRVLRSGMQRGLGRFHYLFGRKLAAQELEMNRPAAAEQVLTKLQSEDRLNTEVFHELARLYVRTGKSESLRASFHATLEAIKKQDLDIKTIRAQVADLRVQMIEAFTRLKNYPAAIEQHIEIINRDPEDEQDVEAAINYVKRYGGAEKLLAYYQRTAGQAYKNYRWNVVLARIYEANGDLPSAARQYRGALDNQPEMLELYDSLANIYTRAKDYDAAVGALNKALELSNDDPQYIKRLIAVLEKAGRHREAEVARQKLPREEEKKRSVSDQFAEAARLRGSERKRAIATYREAFNAVLADPFKHDLKPAEIAGYVQTVRDEEPLDQIMRRLWEFRGRLAAESVRANSAQAGKAKELLAVLDGAVPEAVGGVAAERATGDELSALFSFLKQQIEASANNAGDQNGTLACLQNLSRRAGFGSLEEAILIRQKDIAYSSHDPFSYHVRVKTLVDFYQDRGAYKQAGEILEAERLRDSTPDSFEYFRLIAENARLLGDRDRELGALRENYRKPATNSAPATASEPLIDRYFEALLENGEAGRNELLACVEQPNTHQLQLVNFLLRKGEKDLAHKAIENASLSTAWKFYRNAEASLAQREFSASNQGYFLSALQLAPIGELIAQTPDTAKQLIGDDWFRLSFSYGQWLYLSASEQQKSKSREFLPAMIEDRPQDINEQARLGRWYLEQKNAPGALEHLQLAHESQPENKTVIADLGSAFFVSGDRVKANELWEQIIAPESAIDIADYKLYLDRLVEHDSSESARERLTPLLIKQLQEDFKNEDGYHSDEWTRKFEQMKTLIRDLSASFAEKVNGEPKPLTPAGESAKAAFFLKLCRSATDNRFLPELLIRETLVLPSEAAPFYRLLIARSSGLSSYDRDYAFTDQQQKAWDASGMEEALDHETAFKPSEPDSERTKWQKEFLEYLLEQNQAAEARSLIAEIESSIKRRYARPVWLRLASVRLEIRAGQVAHAYGELAHLVGIETSTNLSEIKPPSLERLNDAVALLRSEGQESEARALLEAAYARQLALAQYEPSSFVGLARLAFERGDATLAQRWLQSMVNLSNEELRAETEAELAALEVVKAHAVEGTSGELPPASEEIEQATALRLAGETAAEFGHFEAALAYRQQLLSVSPDDEANRIELVRLLAASKKTDEAIDNLAAIIGDRTATRGARWQAVWLAPEVTEQQPAAWTRLRERVHTLNAADNEMEVALHSLALSSSGQADESLKLIVATAKTDPNPQLWFLRGVLEKQQGNDNSSLASFTSALIAANDSSAWQAFVFSEDEPLEQIIRLYLKQNQPHAALKLAERVKALQGKSTTTEANEDKEARLETDQPRDPQQGSPAEAVPDARKNKYQTLSERAAERQEDARAELLDLLSQAAEQIGELNRAAELATTRIAFLRQAADKQAARLRVDRLRETLRKTERERKPLFVVDLKLVSAQ
jgi:cellulose synthase operon protein C